MKKLAYVDALRGLAILGVLMVHTGQFGSIDAPWIVEKIAWRGSRGVQLFFIASAFTLFLSYSQRLNSERFPIRNFFIRRFFRIAPLYYLGVCYYLFQDGFGPRYWLGDQPGITPANILSNFLFLHGFNAYWITSIVQGGWSIAVEMQFYVLLPLLFMWLKNTRQAFLFFASSLLFMVGMRVLLVAHPLIGHAQLWSDFLELYLPAQLPVFGLGILLYFLNLENRLPTRQAGGWFLVLSAVMLSLLLVDDHLGIPAFVWFVLPEWVLYGVAFLFLALGLSRYPWPVLVNPVITYIGKISFSLYLVHFAVLYWLNAAHLVDYTGHPIVDLVIRYGLVLLLSGLLAHFLYRFVEVPGQQLGKRLIQRWESRLQVAPSGVREPLL
jgi:peptidoglycan/LPS O-acetylase OafA/YrhL